MEAVVVTKAHAKRAVNFQANSGWWNRQARRPTITSRDEAKAFLAGARTKRERQFYQEKLNSFPS